MSDSEHSSPHHPEHQIAGLTGAQMREHFLNGGAHVVNADQRTLARRTAVNAIVITITTALAAATLALLVALAVTGVGRLLTYALVGFLVLALVIIAVRFWLTRRRLHAAAASTDDYLVVTASGIRFIGIDIPWTRVTAGVGIDGRDRPHNLYSRAGAAISRAAGVAEAEFTFGIRNVRALAHESPRSARGMFELIDDHGGIRIPLDSIIPGTDVHTTMAALVTAGTLAGVDVSVPSAAGEVYRKTVAVLGKQS